MSLVERFEEANGGSSTRSGRHEAPLHRQAAWPHSLPCEKFYFEEKYVSKDVM